MREIGLYHPRIHFPSDTWVKAAALYWTKMARIVPYGYCPSDSYAVCELAEELDFVVDVSPPRISLDLDFRDARWEFSQFVANNFVALRHRYGLHRSGHPAAHVAIDPRTAAVAPSNLSVMPISETKLDFQTRDLLLEHNLASTTSDGSWFMTNPALARVYMSALAEDLARANNLRPVTEDSEVYAVGPGWTEQRMCDVLIPSPTRPGLTEKLDSYLKRRRQNHTQELMSTSEAIGMIAIQAVVPRDLEQIPIKKIIEIRKRYTPQFIAFREAVDLVANEISTKFQAVPDESVLRAYVEQEVQERLLVPLQQLRSDMHRMKVDTATATLTFKYEVPALAGLVAGGVLAQEPLLAGGAAVAIGLLGLMRGMRRQADVLRDKSPVSYLLLLQDNLEARSTLQRAARQMRKATRLP